MPIYFARSEVVCRSVLVDDSCLRYAATSLGVGSSCFHATYCPHFERSNFPWRMGHFDPKDEENTLPRNVGIRLLSGEASRPRRTVSLVCFNFVFATKYTFCYMHKKTASKIPHTYAQN